MSRSGLIMALFLMCHLIFGQLLFVSNHTETEDELLLQLFKNLNLEDPFNTVLLYGKECIFSSILQQLEIPSVIVTEGSTDFDWDYSSLTLILSCGWNSDDERNSRTLFKLQNNRRLIYMKNDEMKPSPVCAQYFGKEQYNIAMIYPDFVQTSLIYACRNFRTPNFVEINLIDDRLQSIYIQQFLNMHGSVIMTDTDNLAPRSMFYQDPDTGEMKILGYVANLIIYFARKVNATLKIRSPPSKEDIRVTIHYGDVVKLIKENLLDIATSLDTTMHESNFDILTYPYLLNSYCFMMPIPAKLPYNQIYTVIVDPLVLGIIFLLYCVFSLLLIYSRQLSWKGLSLDQVLFNDKSLRGLLGQSFPLPLNSNKKLKLICMFLCYASVMMTTMYEAYLQSFFTHPPPQAYLRTFEDVDSSRYLILITQKEANSLAASANETAWSAQKNRTKIVDEWKDFLAMRDTFNKSYIYPVSEVRWRTYQEQQKIFDEPAFYYSEDICLSRFLFLSIPVRRHLPYRDLFEEHMQRQQEFGLPYFWIDRSFYDMVILRITSLEDYSHPDDLVDAIEVNDLSWILEVYVLALIVSCCFFALERFWARKTMTRKVKKTQYIRKRNRF